MRDNHDMQKLMQLARSPAGQKLMDALKQSDSGQVEKAAALARNGSMDQAKNALSGLLDNPEIRQLLRQLEGQL